MTELRQRRSFMVGRGLGEGMVNENFFEVVSGWSIESAMDWRAAPSTGGEYRSGVGEPFTAPLTTFRSGIETLDGPATGG